MQHQHLEKNTHLFNLFNVSNITSITSMESMVSMINETNNLPPVSVSLKNIIQQKYFIKNPSLSCLNFNENGDFLIISTNEISENLRHIDPLLDRVLHQTKICVFDKFSYLPIFFVEKTIKESEFTYAENENSYLKSYVYNKITNFKDDEFDHNRITIHKNYIGSYMVLFFHTNTWFFMFSNNVYEFNPMNHPILFEHLGQHINSLNINLCYHIVLVDVRLRKLITPVCDANYVVLIKTTQKYSLTESFINPHHFFVTDNRIYMSCMDELIVRLEESDILNSKSKKLIHRGFIMKIKIDDFEPVHIAYDTHSYKKIMALVPKGLNLHEVHLRLYQIDKLNSFLQTFNDSYTDIVKRINVSMSTMSREILDIYHMTRKKKNSDLYNALPSSYKHILYLLHSDYINQKNDIEKPGYDSLDYQNNHHNNHNHHNHSYGSLVNFQIDYDKKSNNHCASFSQDNDDSDDIDSKVSITVDNVYIKLKESDTSTLTQLFIDREELIKNIEVLNINELKNPLKSCTNTKIQTKLLSLGTMI